jgi:hypothetical protein
MLGWGRDGDTTTVPDLLIQPLAVATMVEVLLDVASGARDGILLPDPDAVLVGPTFDEWPRPSRAPERRGRATSSMNTGFAVLSGPLRSRRGDSTRSNRLSGRNLIRNPIN